MSGIVVAFKQAGHEVVWVNDSDWYAVKTYKKNFPNTYIVQGDIRQTPASAIPNINILTASFPCQSFSVMGYRRGFKGPLGNLFFEIARIADEKQPQIIFLENVRNLVKNDNGKTFLTIYNTLSELGYYIKYEVMSPHEYANIPQIRERIFIVAFLDEVMCDYFKFPEPIELKTSINEIIHRSERKHDIYYNNSSSLYDNLIRIAPARNSIYHIKDRRLSKLKTVCVLPLRRIWVLIPIEFL